ncbi:MAG: AraC family transcriptional regulator [Pseudorhodoplanes sp.]
MDPLSQVLALLKPGSYGFRGLDAGGDWAISYGAGDGIKCFTVSSGDCWLLIDAVGKPVQLRAGDFVLLPSGKPFLLCSAPDAQVIDAYALFHTVSPGEIAVLNGGGGCSGAGGGFSFEGRFVERLLEVLPPLVHISAKADKAALRWFVERLMQELRNPQPGSALIAEHLAQTLLIEALRVHLADRSQRSTGWLFALADRQMSAVISAMHGDPGRKWTLATLAVIAGMSRSSFAVRFKETVGESAMDYLTRWRMMIAADRLSNAGASIASIAPDVGYESESAFGATFKRVIGTSPREFANVSGRGRRGLRVVAVDDNPVSAPASGSVS